jgi:hypothetical protein
MYFVIFWFLAHLNVSIQPLVNVSHGIIVAPVSVLYKNLDWLLFVSITQTKCEVAYRVCTVRQQPTCGKDMKMYREPDTRIYIVSVPVSGL